MTSKRRIDKIRHHEFRSMGKWFAKGFLEGVNHKPEEKPLNELTAKELAEIANITVFGKLNACNEQDIEIKGIEKNGNLIFIARTNASYKFVIKPNLDLMVFVFGEATTFYNQVEYLTYIRKKLGGI